MNYDEYIKRVNPDTKKIIKYYIKIYSYQCADVEKDKDILKFETLLCALYDSNSNDEIFQNLIIIHC